MRPMKVYLADLGYINKYNYSIIQIPLNIGYIGTYAKKLFANDIQVELFKEPKLLMERCKQVKQDIVGISFCCWSDN